MAQRLAPAARKLFDDRNYAHVATVREDGTVLSVVAWVSLDDEGRVEVNSAEGRAWPKNLRRTGTATVSVLNPERPYEFVSVTGRLVEDTHEGADEHIDALARKYLGADYPFREDGEQRIKFVLEPMRITHLDVGERDGAAPAAYFPDAS